jgi:hypothetical protein
MGADGWQYEVPGQDDPDLALQVLQARVFEEFTRDLSIDFLTFVRNAVPEMRQAIANDKAEGNPYGLLESHEEALKELESLCSQPIPADIAGQIELFRKIWITCALGEPICNVLDTTGTTREWRSCEFLCHILSDEEVLQYFGTQKPTLDQSMQFNYDLYEKLERGDSICWRYHDEAGNPLGWYFVGTQFD